MSKKYTYFKRFVISCSVGFIIMNIVAAFHAYKFTHFDTTALAKTKHAKQLSISEKLKILVFGISNPRPRNITKPSQAYESIMLKSNKEIECWYIQTETPKGTVIIFHGYSGEKSSMLDKSDVFLKLGYNTLLVDFMGAGGSAGDQTTIGFYEAKEVKTTFDFIKSKGEKNIILYGTSMGAAAIMKAQSDYTLASKSIILECPFGTMLETVQSRFKSMHVPSFPMANLLVFWGGFQNNFNAFNHNPIDYSKNITCPTLLLYGSKNLEVSRDEIDGIFNNLKGPKEFKTYPLCEHENYLKKHKEKWTKDITHFLNE